MRLPVLLLAVAVVACGDSAPEPEQPATYEDAMAQVADAVQESGAGSVEPIAAADLAARLPDELLGMEASNREHQNVGAMGMKMSMASAEYRNETKRVNASITDVGGIGRMAPMAAAWSMADFDRTTSSGFERTMRFEGYKGMESSSTSGGRLRTELSLLINDRVVVKLEGMEVELDELKQAAKAMDLNRLARGS